jgi:transcriptional regulator with XRE-family HTH domain
VSDVLNNRLLKALGQRIRELRTEKGFSQEAFADHCGVHRTFMGTIERGESNLSFQNIAKVSEALDITLSSLFAGLEQKAQFNSPGAPGKAAAESRKRRGPARRDG